jgi:hypothetical protein
MTTRPVMRRRFGHVAPAADGGFEFVCDVQPHTRSRRCLEALEAQAELPHRLALDQRIRVALALSRMR